jgi:hypothetical protein
MAGMYRLAASLNQHYKYLNRDWGMGMTDEQPFHMMIYPFSITNVEMVSFPKLVGSVRRPSVMTPL